jgi:thiol-disulfide isomerase/thioredoxin
VKTDASRAHGLDTPGAARRGEPVHRMMVLFAALLAASPAVAAAPALRPATAAAILQSVRAPGARAVVVNIWATWCIPCREELPDILRLRHEYAARGVRFLLVSGDFSTDAEQAAAFLGQLGVDFPTYLKQGTDMEFIDAFDRHWSGALPATFLYDASGHLRHVIHGKTTYAQLDEQLRRILAAER